MMGYYVITSRDSIDHLLEIGARFEFNSSQGFLVKCKGTFKRCNRLHKELKSNGYPAILKYEEAE